MKLSRMLPHNNTISISIQCCCGCTFLCTVNNVGFLYDLLLAARGPFEVIRRYKKVLKAYNRGLKLSAACAYAGVNELTVRSTASIPELATASPADYTKLVDQTHKKKLKDFANVCASYIQSDAQLQQKIDELKSQCKLIPYSKRA